LLLLTDAISKRLLDRFYLFCPSIDISKFIQSALFLKGTRNTGADKADVIARAAQYERNRIAGNPHKTMSVVTDLSLNKYWFRAKAMLRDA
jgi:hypothetical protein